jgi:DNA-binding response OmpR family regulator
MNTTTDNTKQPRVLIVDDSEAARRVLGDVLKAHEFQVTTAANVVEALHLIDSGDFDVLLSDLHMPGPADGFTVVSAMRHKNPEAVRLVFTGFPALKEAMDAMLMQADEILVKPMPMPALISTIRERLAKNDPRKTEMIERVASILERDASFTIGEWLERVEAESELTSVPLSREQRMGHLPRLLAELVQRLRVPRALGTKEVSQAAAKHGEIRREQGYSIPMIIEESRILQVSIFNTLQKNLKSVDFSQLLTDVMTIADEVDSQLKQTIISFSAQSTDRTA